MFVSIVLNTEYSHISYRIRWYLKNLLHCKENGWVLISHEFIKNNFELLQSEIDERFFKEFEMNHFSVDETKDVEQYFIPDSIFENKEKECGSRTEMLLDTAYGDFKELEFCFRDILSSIKENNPNNPIEGVFYSLECFGCIKKVCEEEGIPLYAYSFSAIRKPHGYRQTLFLAHPEGEMFGSHDSEARYSRFLNEDSSSIPVFSNREILAILGKQRNLSLLQLIDHEPQYEMARCNDLGAMIPRSFVHTRYTDDDLRYETELRFKSNDIVVRNHAAQLGYMQIDKSDIHNDPVSVILSCKRLAAVHSQIMLKALMWKRSVISPKYTMGFSFLCNTDYYDTKVADIKGLNFYIFCCLIPGGLMFSDSYWRWRLTKPTECEIYNRHLEYYINVLNLPETILTEKSEVKRLELILRSRECDEEVIRDVLDNDQSFDVNFFAASSLFIVEGKRHWRLNKRLADGTLVSTICLDSISDNKIDFYPLDDVAGFTRIKSVTVNGTGLELDDTMTSFKFMPKTKGYYSLTFDGIFSDVIKVVCTWEYKKVFDYLNNN